MDFHGETDRGWSGKRVEWKEKGETSKRCTKGKIVNANRQGWKLFSICIIRKRISRASKLEGRELV